MLSLETSGREMVPLHWNLPAGRKKHTEVFSGQKEMQK